MALRQSDDWSNLDLIRCACQYQDEVAAVYMCIVLCIVGIMYNGCLPT